MFDPSKYTIFEIKHSEWDPIHRLGEDFHSLTIVPISGNYRDLENFTRKKWKELGGIVILSGSNEDLDYFEPLFAILADGEELDYDRIHLDRRHIEADSLAKDVIRKEKEGYTIYSEKGKKLSKPYKTKEEAEKRLKEIEMFKHMKKDALEKPELYGKKVKVVVNNALSSTLEKMFGSDVISKNAKSKNEIEFVLPYDSRTEYLTKRFHKKFEVMDSSYKGYDIEYKGDLWQVWEDRHDRDKLIAGDFPSEEEAMEWIDAQIEKRKKEEPLHRYDVWFVNYDTDESEVERNVEARSEKEARRIVKEKYGDRIYGYPRDVYLVDRETGGKSMLEEVKKWLERYLVKADDPDNKIGKTHIRPLRKEETLEKGIKPMASSETSGILHYKGGEYYWYIDKDDSVHVERYLKDSVEKRFVCESRKDGKLIDAKEFGKEIDAKSWAMKESQKGNEARVIDKHFGQVWILDPNSTDEDLEEIVATEEQDKVHLWIVEWYNKNGVKFTAEFDSEEDAEMFVDIREEDGGVYNMRIVEKDVLLGDSVIRFDPEKTEKAIREILYREGKSKGYDRSDIDEYVTIRFKEGVSEDGKPCIKTIISHDLGEDFEFYEISQEAIEDMEKLIGWLEPYDARLWEACKENISMKDSPSCETKDEMPASETHQVEFDIYTRFVGFFGEEEIRFSERMIEEFDDYEEAKEAAEEDSYGVPGEYVKVFLDGEFCRDYEVE